jgi:hypothetical protein
MRTTRINPSSGLRPFTLDSRRGRTVFVLYPLLGGWIDRYARHLAEPSG